MQSVDTSKTVKVAYSRRKICLYLVLFLLFTAGFAWLALVDTDKTLFHSGVFYFGLIFFGAGSLVVLWKLVKGGTALTVSPDGIHDPRFASETIPWSAIVSVSGYKMHRQKCVFVALMPDYQLGLHLKRHLRWANFGRLPAGLSIGLATLALNYDELLQLIQNYMDAHALR